MGIRRARRVDGRLSLGRQHQPQQGQLQPLRKPLGPQKDIWPFSTSSLSSIWSEGPPFMQQVPQRLHSDMDWSVDSFILLMPPITVPDPDAQNTETQYLNFELPLSDSKIVTVRTALQSRPGMQPTDRTGLETRPHRELI